MQAGKGAALCGNIKPGDLLLEIDGHTIGSLKVRMLTDSDVC
jgi:hypothetical protein